MFSVSTAHRVPDKSHSETFRKQKHISCVSQRTRVFVEMEHILHRDNTYLNVGVDTCILSKLACVYVCICVNKQFGVFSGCRQVTAATALFFVGGLRWQYHARIFAPSTPNTNQLEKTPTASTHTQQAVALNLKFMARSNRGVYIQTYTYNKPTALPMPMLKPSQPPAAVVVVDGGRPRRLRR